MINTYLLRYKTSHVYTMKMVVQASNEREAWYEGHRLLRQGVNPSHAYGDPLIETLTVVEEVHKKPRTKTPKARKPMNNINLVNLTPHDIKIIINGETTTIPRSGQVARVTITSKVVGTVNGIEIRTPTPGDVEGLPEPKEGTMYIVSRLVADSPSVRSRKDILVPDGLVRDEAGNVVGASGLATPSL